MRKHSVHRIRKAVILAGGRGTRLLPLTRAVPKEMLPLGPKPILQHIVDELRAAGLEEILIVSRTGKPAIAKHFEEERSVTVLTKEEALGPGHSVMTAREYLQHESFLVAFGDAPFGGSRASVFTSELLETHESLKAAAVLSVERAPKNEIQLRAIVEPENPLRPGIATPITGLVQKPEPSKAPCKWAVAGRYTFGPSVFDALAVVASRATGEILLADALKHMLAEGRQIYALPLGKDQHRYDTGSMEGYFRAVRVFAGEFLRND